MTYIFRALMLPLALVWILGVYVGTSVIYTGTWIAYQCEQSFEWWLRK